MKKCIYRNPPVILKNYNESRLWLSASFSKHPLRKVTGEHRPITEWGGFYLAFSNFVSDFIDENKKFFFLNSRAKCCRKPLKTTIRSHRKNCIIVFTRYAPTKYPSRETVPLIHHWVFPCMVFVNYVLEREFFTLRCLCSNFWHTVIVLHIKDWLIWVPY